MLKKMKQIDDLVSEKVRDDCAKIIRLFLIFIIFLNMTAYLQKIIFVRQVGILCELHQYKQKSHQIGHDLVAFFHLFKILFCKILRVRNLSRYLFFINSAVASNSS
jgi:hypothetical protein